jgi:hypothetical protein
MRKTAGKRQPKSGTPAIAKSKPRKTRPARTVAAGNPPANRFGLSRSIPESVKREVRHSCGFGCVLCGGALYEYDHLDVGFADAEEHDASKIVLLCPQHHAERTRGLLSNTSVQVGRKAPKAKQRGFSQQVLDCGPGPWIDVEFGTVVATHVRTVLQVAGDRVIYLSGPEEVGAPSRLNAEFYDSAGSQTCRIVENEVQALSDAWDVTLTGPQLTIRRGHGDIVLQLVSLPGRGIRVERLNMVYRGRRIDLVPDVGVRVRTGSFEITLGSVGVSNGEVALSIG